MEKRFRALRNAESSKAVVRITALGVGLVAVLVPSFLYTREQSFPGWAALPPCVGTLLILFARASGRWGFVLTNRLSVGIGKLSYSLYLVHWPLIVFYRFHTLRAFTIGEQVGLFAASVAGACLLHFLVESPLRRPPLERQWLPGLRFVGVALVVASVVAVGGLGVRHYGGLEKPVSRSNQQVLDYLKNQNDRKKAARRTRRDECYVTTKSGRVHERCLQPSTKLANFLILGDSHAANWYAGMKKHFDGRAHLSLSAVMSCRILPFPTSKHPACQARNDHLFRRMDLAVYDAVFVAGQYYGAKENDALPRAFEQLRARGAQKLILLGLPMSYQPSVPVIMSRYSDADDVDERVAVRLSAKFLPADKALQQSSERARVPYYSIADFVCSDSSDASTCRHFIPGEGLPFVRDKKHLSVRGVRWLWRQWEAEGKSPLIR